MQVKLYGAIIVASLFMVSESVSAEIWTLNSSIERAYQYAPEIKLAENEREARQAAVENAAFWPNPTVDVRVDNKLGLDDGSGGYDVTDVGITQPIPLKRLKHQKDFAEANVQVADHELELKRLLLETAVAKDFHELQYAQAEYAFAKERLSVATDLQEKSVKNKQGIIVRYMTPLEKMRLNIIKEEATQMESSAEGRYKEALTKFEKRLNLEVSESESAVDLQKLDSLAELKYFVDRQSAHASLAAQQKGIVAARAEIEVAKSRRLNDPELRLSRSVDYFSQGQDEVYGLTLNVQIPLWSSKNPEVVRAEYSASQRNIELQQMRRELQIQIKQSHTHLGHLIEQAEHHKLKVLQPSAEMLRLTNKGFISGELNLLTLIDANNTYFDAQLRYSDLLYQAWNEYADLRRASGILLSTMPVISAKNMKGVN
jgi:outer membrane protein, heavy metal efflux system